MSLKAPRYSDQRKVIQYEAGVKHFLGTVDLPWAVITDQSSIGDFSFEDEYIAKLAIRFGMPVTKQTLIWHLALSLVKRDHTRSKIIDAFSLLKRFAWIVTHPGHPYFFYAD